MQQKITGDVGQVAGQDIINSAPQHRLSNTVNIKMADDAQPKTITELQRKAISTKVYEVNEKTAIERRTIYSDILRDYGIEVIRDLPRDRYKEVMASLDQYMNQIGKGASLAVAEDERAGFCTHCTKISHHLKQTRLALGAVCVLLLAISAKTLLVIADSHATSDSMYRMMHRCDFEGRAYSVGSSVVMPNNRQCECIFNMERSIAHWIAVKQESN